MEHFGWRDGVGIGKNLQGRSEPVIAQSTHHFACSNQVHDTGDNSTSIFQPLIKINVSCANTEVSALIDSGSQINGVSEEFYRTHLKNQPGVLILPISNVFLRLANGVKSKRIGPRVQTVITICEQNIVFECFVVPGLILPLMIGNEFSFKHQSKLCWEKRSYRFLYDSNVIDCPFVIHTMYGVNFVTAEVGDNITTTLSDKLNGLETDLRNNFLQKVTKLQEVFGSRPGLTDKYTHRIVMKSEIPFAQRSYPVPYALRPAVETELKRMIELGIIQRASSDYNSPMTVVRKKDNTVRICLDARELNKNMVNDLETPPPIDEIIQKFHGVKILSIIDLQASYWQIPLAPESRKYTSFSYNGRLYEYLVLPFGLKTAVASFSRAMDTILGPEVREYVTTYVDDLLITSANTNEHLEHLYQVLKKLNEAKVTINLGKTLFFKPEVKFLGYILSAKGIQPDPGKVEAIERFPVPRRPKDVRAFLGLCNFYRKFQVDFAVTAKTLQDLTKKDVKWRWGEIEDTAFKELKQMFLRSVTLAHPDPKLPFTLQTDSSDIGLGGVLYQTNQRGEELVIQFISRAFRGPELNYTTTEKELLAIVSCLKKVRLYLLGVKFTIKTDHHALLFLRPDNVMHDRLTRWLLYLQNFDFEFVHIRGTKNQIPDLLSRKPHDRLQITEGRSKEFLVAALPIDNRVSVETQLKRVKEAQYEDEHLLRLIHKPEKFYLMENQVLYRQKVNGEQRICLPQSLVNEVTHYLHQEIGHAGTAKTYTILSQYFYCKNLYKLVKQKVTSCEICQKSKCNNRKYDGPSHPIVPDGVGALVAIDYFGPLPTSTFGMTHILVVLDVFSKYTKLYPVRRATTNITIKKIQDYRKVIDIKSVLADHGSQFRSPKFHAYLRENDIKAGLTSINHPASNPAERVMRELGRMLRTYCQAHNAGWYKMIEDIETCFNEIPHESTGVCANEIIFKNPRIAKMVYYTYNISIIYHFFKAYSYNIRIFLPCVSILLRR